MPRAERVDYNEDTSEDEEMPRRSRSKLKRRASSASSSRRSRKASKTIRKYSAGNSRRGSLNYRLTRYGSEDRKVANLTRSLSEITVLCHSESRGREKEKILGKTLAVVESDVIDEISRKTASKCKHLSLLNGWKSYLLGIDNDEDDIVKWQNWEMRCVSENKPIPELWNFFSPPLQADRKKNLLYDRCFRLEDDKGQPDLMTLGDCFTTPIVNENKPIPLGVIMALYRKFDGKPEDCKIQMKLCWLYFINDVKRDECQKELWRDQIRKQNLPPEKAVFVSNNEMENDLQKARRRIDVMPVQKFRRLLDEKSPAASDPTDHFFWAGTFDNITNWLEVVDCSSSFIQLRAKLDLLPEYKEKRRKKRASRKL